MNEDQSQQQGIPYPMSPSMFQQERSISSIIEYLGEMNLQIEMFEHDLRGEIAFIDEETGERKWKSTTAGPWMNDEGIRYIISHLRSIICTPNTYFSQIDMKDLHEKCWFYEQDVIFTLMYCHKKFDLKREYYGDIVERFSFILEMALRKSLNGKFIEMINTTAHIWRQEGAGAAEGEKKLSIWERLFRW